MPYSVDAIVVVILLIVIAVWIGFGIARWLEKPPSGLTFMLKSSQPEGKANMKLLEEHGYEVLSGKVRIPIAVYLNEQSLKTRIYLDYVVRQDDQIFVVKVAKERDDIRWTGSTVRDQFMSYALLHEHIDGVLYIEPKQKLVHKIVFQFED